MPRTLTISLQDTTAPRETPRASLPFFQATFSSRFGPWQPTGSLAHVFQRRELGGLLLNQSQIFEPEDLRGIGISRGGGLTRRKKKIMGNFVTPASSNPPRPSACGFYHICTSSGHSAMPPLPRKELGRHAWVLVRCSLRPPRRRSSTLEPVGASSESAELHHG